MRITKATVMVMGLLLTCLSFVSTARADGIRSYISPTGSDNRPCTRNQPCRTFDTAIAKTDAGGEVIALDTGTYDPTTITKAITLAAAPGADVAIRATGGNAVTVATSTSDTIVLRGLRLGGPGKNVAGTNGVFVRDKQRQRSPGLLLYRWQRHWCIHWRWSRPLDGQQHDREQRY